MRNHSVDLQGLVTVYDLVMLDQGCDLAIHVLVQLSQQPVEPVFRHVYHIRQAVFSPALVLSKLGLRHLRQHLHLPLLQVVVLNIPLH